MKYLKQLFSLIIIGFLAFRCNQNERSVGFNDWTDDGTEFKFHLGTEQSIDIVKKWDELQNNGDWEGALELFADTATVTYQNGQKVAASEMTEMARKRDSNYKANNVDYSWTL